MKFSKYKTIHLRTVEIKFSNETTKTGKLLALDAK